MRVSRLPLVIVVAVASSVTAAERVYVGAQVCRECHGGGHRDQYAAWFRSPHARAWAALAKPESLEIARLSGIHENPFANPVCLGCHATASDTEDWERDPTFSVADGVQCELCHGPGSDYISAEVMRDPARAAAAGLRTPTTTTCLICHKEKGSHTAVIGVRPFDIDEALARIGHSGRGGELAPPQPSLPTTDVDYVGARACRRCHSGGANDYIFSAWRLTGHADAWAALSGPEGRRIAADEGVAGDPARARTCLSCHSTGSGSSRLGADFDPTLGVQCESCHGPGAAHAASAETDPPSLPDRQTCERCHTPGIHGTPPVGDWREWWSLVDHSLPTLAQAVAAEKPYKTPFNLVVSPDGERLYVACEASSSLIVIDTTTRTVVAEITVGQLPHGVCLSPDGELAYVSNRGSDTVSVIDTTIPTLLGTIAVGDEPHGLATDTRGDTLYVANAGSHDISVVDLGLGREVKRLAAGRGAWDVARSPDGGHLFVTNNLSHFVPFRTPSLSEVTVVASDRSVVDDRVMVPEANLLQGVATAPSGEYTLATMIRTKNLVPMTRVMQGWVMTNGLAVLWRDGRVDQVLLDEPERYFADPTDVVITPDGGSAFVTGGGIDAVAVVDLARLVQTLEAASEHDRVHTIPNSMGIATEIVERRIPVGSNPRGLAISPDGRFVYVSEALDDTVGVIDVERRERVAGIDLGGREELTLARAGELIFHSADVTFGGQFSCHSCHPDGGVDGITYDIEPDGIGLNPVDNRSLRGILDTAPFKWTGKNATIGRQCGPRLAVFFTRIDPFTPDQVTALERYIQTIPRNPNRFRTGDTLTPAQRRGKLLFEREFSNSGEPLAANQRCVNCHPGPYFTNRERVSVGTASELDTHDVFDVPHLTNIYESAPYLHDGRAETLEEIWTRFNPEDRHGATNDMTKDQLNDLVEYLKTL